MRTIDADALVNQLIAEMDADTDKSIQATLARALTLLICNAIEKQPTIKPQREKGKWIRDAVWFTRYYCSQCGEKTEDTIMGEPRYKWCPMCGAKMEAET